MSTTTEGTGNVRLPPHLSSDRTIHVLISTHSGQHEAEEYYTTHLHPYLESLSPPPRLPRKPHLTTAPTSITTYTLTQILPLATKGAKQTILLLSGDGGIIDIVNTLATALMRDTYDNRAGSVFVRPVVCLLPLGTANALAGSAGISLGSWRADSKTKGQDQDKHQGTALSVMLSGTPKPLPIFEVRFSPGSKLVTNEGRDREAIADTAEPTIYGAVVFSWCLHASLVATSDTTEYRKHGVERFKMAAAELMQEEHRWKGRVRIKKERDAEWEDLRYHSDTNTASIQDAGGNENEHVYIIAPLVSQLDPGFVISPHTKTPDDVLRLLAVSPPPSQPPTQPTTQPEPSPTSPSSSSTPPQPSTSSYTSHISSLLSAAYSQGSHIPSPHITYHALTHLRIEMHEPSEKWRYVCVDGKIIAVEEEGWVEVRMLEARGMEGRRVVDVVV